MNQVIQRLILKRFRSVPSQVIDFERSTFLVGRNGSGKSNILDAFSFLAEATALPLQAIFDRRGGIGAVRNRTSGQSHPPNLGLGVVFGPLNGNARGGRYAFEVKAIPKYGFEVVREQCVVLPNQGERHWFNRTMRGFSSNVKGLDPALDPSSLGLPVVGGDARFAPVVRALAGIRVHRIDPARLREMQDPDSGTTLRADGSNASSVVQELERTAQDDFARLHEILATIVPNTKSVRTKKHGNKLALEFLQEWGDGKAKKSLRFEAFNMSDGTLRALGLLTAVYQRPRPSVLSVEEPEATIHPGALGAILDLLRHASRQMQVVVTTHSPEVLDAKWITEDQIRIVDWQAGATRVGHVCEAARQTLQEHLMGAGELLRSNALETEPLFEPEAAQLDLFEEVA